MRIMQLGHSHFDYLKNFARRFKGEQSHAALMRAYVNDYYWCSHTLTPALERQGHEVFLCVPTEPLSQGLWCREHGVTMDASGMTALMAQVAWFQPDILYVSCPGLFPDAVLQHLPFRPKAIVGWHATVTQPNASFSRYDLMLSSHEECLDMARKHGARRTAVAYPGIPVELKDAFPKVKRTDLCFSGYWGPAHPRRNQFLLELAQRLPSLPPPALNCAYHLGFFDNGPPCPDQVQRCNRGAVWGLSMFKAFAMARIVLNGYATVTHAPQNLSPNMRQLEALGVGSFLLTDRSDNLEAFFTEGQDLATYASTDELVEKALYYLKHKEERERMAQQGLATCQRYYTMDIRARAFMDTVRREVLAHSPPPAERLTQELRAAAEAGASADTAFPLTQQTVEATRALLLAGDTHRGLALLDTLQTLPVAELQHLHLCQALRAYHTGQPDETARLLRRELDLYPENDAARHCLSRLVLKKSLCSHEAGA